jgi:4-amino-4-deoxy-L-arabinose transferase-like glycosyltransferase
MFQRLNHRAGHYALLAAVAAGLFLVNLGGPSLWDIDEGNNAEAAREMMQANKWVIPTFNFVLRTDKPALLYWLQISAYHVFGVNEFAARFPSALAALATVLMLYELGRLIFGAGAGLLAGLVLASTPGFCGSAHFANPDALLNAFTTLTLLFFWHSYARRGNGWFVLSAISAALAVLAKGPVGLLLPLAVTGLFLLWSGQLRLVFQRRLALGVLAFIVVALPWYAYVGAETKGEFLRGFFLTHNYGRYLQTMENHRGSVSYYPVVLLIGFSPWSAFFGLAGWYGLRGLKGCSEGFDNRRTDGQSVRPLRTDWPSFQRKETVDPRAAFRFLWCWIGTYLLFFSVSSTKLPNYVLPLYPPLALLIAHFFDRWLRGEFQPAAWIIHISLACLAFVGLGLGLGLLAVGGVVPLHLLRSHYFPGLERGAALGLLLVLAAGGAWWLFRRHRHGQMVALIGEAAVVVVGCLAAWTGSALNDYKAPRELAAKIHAHQTEREIRIGCHEYFQPSLVFYSLREVERLDKELDALEFLASPLPRYLFLPASVWESWQSKGMKACHVLGRRHDLYRNCEIVVVTNR